MRLRASNGGISVHAIVSTDVVMFAFEATRAARRNLLGFAIHRSKEGAIGDGIWLQASKVFEAIEPATNATLVEKATKIVRLFGAGTASTSEARAILRLPVASQT